MKMLALTLLVNLMLASGSPPVSQANRATPDQTRASNRQASQPEPPPAGRAPESDLYVLRVGDELTIKVFNEPDLQETVQVRPDGKISVQLLDDAPAAGLTTQQLDEKLTAGYSEYYTDPQVTVILKSFSTFKVYVGGEVAQPGTLPIVGNLTASMAVIQAGGFKPTARTEHVMLLRNVGLENPLVEQLNLREILEKGKPDVALKPFDVIYVPMSKISRINKFVDQYIRQLIPISVNSGFTYILGNKSSLLPQP